MTVTLTDSGVVLALWWTVLAVALLVVVPLAVYLLHRTWRAARMIERYTADTLAAARGVAEHTASIPALDRTVEAAGPLKERTGRLVAASERLGETLSSRLP